MCFIVREFLYFFTGDNFRDNYTYKQEKFAFLILAISPKIILKH